MQSWTQNSVHDFCLQIGTLSVKISRMLENNAFGKVWYFRRRTRACLKDVFHKMCFTLYGVQIAGMIFQTHSGARLQFEIYNYIIIK